MARYLLTKKAVEDISKIWNYTYEVWSENQADKYYFALLDCCQDLAESPELGRNYDKINPELFGYKSGHHIIFYRKINPTNIEVTRILHERMDLENRIQE